MLNSIKNALDALLLNQQIKDLKASDVMVANLHKQLTAHQIIIENINLEDEEKRACALISLYLFLWYLNTYHATTLATVAKEYLRLRG
jgi:hypothetical protein